MEQAQSNFEHQCNFPAVIIYDDELSLYEGSYAYITCRMTDIRAGERGRFARSSLIDSNGKMWRIQGATVLHGVGRFWGWSLFFNRTVKVSPIIMEGPFPADLELVRREVLSRLTHRDAFSIELHRFVTYVGRAAARRLVPAVERATSVPEIISVLLTADFPERERITSEANAASNTAPDGGSGKQPGNSGVTDGRHL